MISKYKGERPRKRLRMLINLKTKTYLTRKDIVSELGVGKRTLKRWINIYEKNGIDVSLIPAVRFYRSKGTLSFI